ncbi:Oidioi.mRNA.OKI2018_I69.XSR.g15066.t1.cds [Oikopleura dioica]|uniref:Oidioi.mRNA.OKI2018_I69.XSR.g15066.t1.cds n=1 Tax=Oikopleura dioica TaxID=34765 RepID=A0ABN7SC54_OIKDI|nr:Oidioi.mRNA.OKI2018_I69.XSR.g15066.t1.cds [Oikopleura dioica]
MAQEEFDPQTIMQRFNGFPEGNEVAMNTKLRFAQTELEKAAHTMNEMNTSIEKFLAKFEKQKEKTEKAKTEAKAAKEALAAEEAEKMDMLQQMELIVAQVKQQKKEKKKAVKDIQLFINEKFESMDEQLRSLESENQRLRKQLE